ncbi:MAG: PhzF family phenazine biosynthesis protein [Bacteroidota bacterium]
MKYPYYTCDVFTDTRFGGNQLAVFPAGASIPEELLQTIAKEFNFSETTFVYPPNDPKNTNRLRIFTPGGELPFAGHPTIGTAFVLAAIGAIPIQHETNILFEEGVGNVPVKILSQNGAPHFMELSAAQMPEFSAAPSGSDIAKFLSLPENDLDETYPIQSVSCGVPFLFVAVKSRGSLKRIRINTELMNQTLRTSSAKDVFVFTTDAEQADFDFRARMFAPLLGIPEDPATGSAAASFAGYLATLDSVQNGTLKRKIEQGFEMGRPSLLYIEADKKDGKTTAIRVGGSAVMVCKGEMEI